MFPLLPNVAWTNEGAVDLDELPERQLLARLNGKVLEVNSVDKFPKMTDYVVPKGVRIADTSRVRLGAYVGEGTTIMHEGFINFNAGTEGPGMIEGRISAGVFVGKGSDIGGGASTMGTLSGGGNIIISWAKAACWAPMPAPASRWATAPSKPACTSPPAPRCNCWTTRARSLTPSKPATWLASPTCCSAATPPTVPCSVSPTRAPSP